MLGQKPNKKRIKSGSSLSEIREATGTKEKDQSVQFEDNNPTNAMDPGNATGPISPTVNLSSNTNLNLQQLLTVVHQLPTYEGHLAILIDS